jgi:hypothetical protein
MKLDRATARALVDAGYMPLSDYISQFADDFVSSDSTKAAAKADTVVELGHHRTRRWTVPAHFASRKRSAA